MVKIRHGVFQQFSTLPSDQVMDPSVEVVYAAQFTRQPHAGLHTATHSTVIETMRPILLFCLLAMVLFLAHGQSPTCTINMPGNQCGQTPNLSVDDQCVKSSIIGLQTQIQQLMSDNVKLRQDVDGINAGKYRC